MVNKLVRFYKDFFLNYYFILARHQCKTNSLYTNPYNALTRWVLLKEVLPYLTKDSLLTSAIDWLIDRLIDTIIYWKLYSSCVSWHPRFHRNDLWSRYQRLQRKLTRSDAYKIWFWDVLKFNLKKINFNFQIFYCTLMGWKVLFEYV